LYYYSGESDAQIWTVQKRDPTLAEVHYGDDVCFVNKRHSGQALAPYWSRLLGGVYLTTQSDGPYYWLLRTAVPT
jgi:hypothetical protein